MLSPKKLLENARNRISKRENWTTGYMAKPDPNHSGSVRYSITDPGAVCWCSLGALGAEAGISSPDDMMAYSDGTLEHEYLTEAIDALKDAIRTLVGTSFSVWYFNDTSSHEDVLKMFDTAIANLKGE